MSSDQAMSDSVRVTAAAVSRIAARIANNRRVLGVVFAVGGLGLFMSFEKHTHDHPEYAVLLLAAIAGAGFAFFLSSRMDRVAARARAAPQSPWVVEGFHVKPTSVTNGKLVRALTFKVGGADRRALLNHRVVDEQPAVPHTESPAASTEQAAVPTELPKPQSTGKPPFRVQGYHVAEFAKRVGDRTWKKALLWFLFAGLAALYTVTVVLHLTKSFNDDQMVGIMVPIVVAFAGVVVGRRHLARSEQLQTIAESALADPEAVWGVKDTWLYPLKPSAPRKQLSVTLDANEHRDIYKKPGPPKHDTRNAGGKDEWLAPEPFQPESPPPPPPPPPPPTSTSESPKAEPAAAEPTKPDPT